MVGLAGSAVAVCSAGEGVGDSDGCWMSISLKLGIGARWRVGSVSCCDGSPVPSSPLFLVLTLRADLPRPASFLCVRWHLHLASFSTFRSVADWNLWWERSSEVVARLVVELISLRVSCSSVINLAATNCRWSLEMVVNPSSASLRCSWNMSSMFERSFFGVRHLILIRNPLGVRLLWRQAERNEA